MKMSIEKVREYLKENNCSGSVMEFDQSSATVELAAQAVGVIPARISKTMSFDVKGRTVLILLAGDVKVDNGKFKQQFATKAKIISYDDVQGRTGHPVGGVCPFAIDYDNIDVYLDTSMKRFETVFPAAGSPNSAVELTPDELERLSQSKGWIDVAKYAEEKTEE